MLLEGSACNEWGLPASQSSLVSDAIVRNQLGSTVIRSYPLLSTEVVHNWGGWMICHFSIIFCC